MTKEEIKQKLQEIIDLDLKYLSNEGSEFIDRSTIRMIEKKLLSLISELEKH
ncbi:hypothetical protein N5J54_11125 [Acinetobacter ursingii]|uniref:hypothetical protein n=1 Tax=Acinetobacter ursingii TaxID=108980 RepID=UPI00148F1FA0|nr:hypothetical protein [Acinetobacter ursingii]MCU4350997.1 hypothetical protein [Acinetobacter ursingii]MDH2104277.1 hypothetical protein [Acinetobacter ursingii]